MAENLKLTQQQVILERNRISIDEAIEVLDTFTEGRKKRVHTFENGSFGLMGCNMDLSQIKIDLKAAQFIWVIKENNMGHRVGYSKKGRSIFVETIGTKVTSLCKAKKI